MRLGETQSAQWRSLRALSVADAASGRAHKRAGQKTKTPARGPGSQT